MEEWSCQASLERRLQLPATVKPSEDAVAEAQGQVFFINAFARPLLEATALAIPGEQRPAGSVLVALTGVRQRCRSMSGSASRTWRCGSGRERRLKRGRDATRRARSTLRVRSRCRCRGPRRPGPGHSGRRTRRGVSGRETGRTGTHLSRLPFMVVVRFISWEFRRPFSLTPPWRPRSTVARAS